MAIDDETAELIKVLRNSVRNPGSVFDRAATRLRELAEENGQLLALTESLDEHPEEYDGPCRCADCRYYAAQDVVGEPEVMA